MLQEGATMPCAWLHQSRAASELRQVGSADDRKHVVVGAVQVAEARPAKSEARSIARVAGAAR